MSARSFIQYVQTLFYPNSSLHARLFHILGFKPRYLPYYQIALTHRSQADENKENNERLEYLGDAFLGAVVGEYLFKKYPNEFEGFLSETRSKIVRRETLNKVAMRMGLQKLMIYNNQDRGLTHSHIFGNALEALVGAVYLDQGFDVTRTFILDQIIKQYINIDEMVADNSNYKNQLLTWAQRSGRNLVFEYLGETREGSRKVFSVGIVLDDETVAIGKAYNKKEAGQVAAKEGLKWVEEQGLQEQ